MVPGTGPLVVFFGVINNSDGCVFCCDPSCATTPTPTPHIEMGRRVYDEKSGQFLIVVEGAVNPVSLGGSGQAPGSQLGPVAPSNRPDLQIESTQDMGASPTSGKCDKGMGGIPGINPPNFSPDANPTPGFISNALDDFACRFQVLSPSLPCTYIDNSGIAKPINPATVVQFCDTVAPIAAFRPGDSIVTVQLRDTTGNIGPTAQIVVRVVTPTRTPTPKH